MTSRESRLGAFRSSIQRLVEPGILGFYTDYDVIEIFAVEDGAKIAHNVFSLLIAEETPHAGDKEPVYVGSRIRLPSLDGWGFGIRRSKLPLKDLEGCLLSYEQTGEWRLSEPLNIGQLAAISPQFVAPDSTKHATLERCAKKQLLERIACDGVDGYGQVRPRSLF